MIFYSLEKIRAAALSVLVPGLLLGLSAPAAALGLERVGTITPKGTDTELLSPLALCFDPLREILTVADTEGRRIVLLDRQGNTLKVLEKNGDPGFPLAVAVSGPGTLFIAERDREFLKVLPAYDDPAAGSYQLFDLSPHRRSRPVRPVALFVDDDSSLLVADRGNRQLLVFDRDRSFKFAIPDVGEPADVWSSQGRVYIADPGFGRIRVFDEKGRWLRNLGDNPSQFREPLRVKAIAVDRRERLWAIEETGGIRALDSLGNQLFALAAGQLFSPVDLAVDAQNNLYVLEQGGGRISVFRIDEF